MGSTSKDKIKSIAETYRLANTAILDMTHSDNYADAFAVLACEASGETEEQLEAKVDAFRDVDDVLDASFPLKLFACADGGIQGMPNTVLGSAFLVFDLSNVSVQDKMPRLMDAILRAWEEYDAREVQQ